MLVLLVFLALLREPRPRAPAAFPPAALGRVPAWTGAPEVKTIRRKLGELAAAGKAAALQTALASHHASARPDALGRSRQYSADIGAQNVPSGTASPSDGLRPG